MLEVDAAYHVQRLPDGDLAGAAFQARRQQFAERLVETPDLAFGDSLQNEHADQALDQREGIEPGRGVMTVGVAFDAQLAAFGNQHRVASGSRKQLRQARRHWPQDTALDPRLATLNRRISAGGVEQARRIAFAEQDKDLRRCPQRRGEGCGNSNACKQATTPQARPGDYDAKQAHEEPTRRAFMLNSAGKSTNRCRVDGSPYTRSWSCAELSPGRSHRSNPADILAA